jgi:hypothetical protein
MQRKAIVVSLITLCCLASLTAFGASGDKTKVQGMIIARAGETMVQNSQGKITVVLDDDTRTKDNTGLFGLDRKELSHVVLIPGLKVSVEGVKGRPLRMRLRQLASPFPREGYGQGAPLQGNWVIALAQRQNLP